MAPCPSAWRRGLTQNRAQPRPTGRKRRSSTLFGPQRRDGMLGQRPAKLPRPRRRRRVRRRPSPQRLKIPRPPPLTQRPRFLPSNPGWSRGWPIPSTRTVRSRRSCRKASSASARSPHCAVTSSAAPSLTPRPLTGHQPSASAAAALPPCRFAREIQSAKFCIRARYSLDIHSCRRRRAVFFF